MAKFVIYCAGSDQFLCDGNEPFIGTEEEVKRVLKHEVVDSKKYEIKPIKFLKQWAIAEKKKEEKAKKAKYEFSPGEPEFHYKKPEGQARYLLILGKEDCRKTGMLVKDFDTLATAVTMAQRSIKKVSEELPGFSYFVFDSELYTYVKHITDSESKPISSTRSRNGKRKIDKRTSVAA